MVNKPRIIGTTWENKVRDFLSKWFPRVTREDFSSPLGDLKGTGCTIECKDHRHITLSEFMTQVKRADAKTGHDMPIVVVKKRNANVKDAYFVTDLEHGAILMKALEICREQGVL